jgi:hypothetical protein
VIERATILGKLLVAKVLLVSVFILSFVQYFVPITVVTQVVPIALMLCVGFFLFFRITRKRGLAALVPGVPMLVAAIFPLIFSFFVADKDPALYGTLMVAVLLAARIIVATIGLDAVMSCYFYASIINVIILIVSSAGELVAFRFGGGRFAPFEFHPNLLAFILATYIPIQWCAPLQSRRTKNLARAFAIVSGLLLISTISRGSVMAVLCGLLAFFLMRFVAAMKSRQLRFSRRQALLACLAVFVLVSIAYTQQQRISDAFATVYSVFELDSKYRGLQTGLTGRTDIWLDTLNMLSDGSWLSGNGYRTGGERVGTSLDNGYLTVLFELGCFPAVFIILRYVYALSVSGQLVLKVHEPEPASWSTALFVFLIIFLVNNIVARYVFGYGNPASLLGLFLLIATGDEVKEVNSAWRREPIRDSRLRRSVAVSSNASSLRRAAT